MELISSAFTSQQKDDIVKEKKKHNMMKKKVENLDSSLSDQEEDDSSTMSMDEEGDDSMASLDGAIPIMAQYYQSTTDDDSEDDDDDDEEVEEDMEQSSPSIHYLGREYKADQFRNSAEVLSQSAITQRTRRHVNEGKTNMTTRLLSNLSDHSTNDRWSLLTGEIMAAQPKSTPKTRRASMSQSEHWGASSRRRGSISPKRNSVAANRNSMSPKPRPRGGRRASVSVLPPPPPIGGAIMSPPKLGGALSPNGVSTRGKFLPNNNRAMASQSEYFGSTRRRASIATTGFAHGPNGISSRSGHNTTPAMRTSSNSSTRSAGGANRRASSATDYMRQAVGKFMMIQSESAANKKAERWQHSLARWGYTNHDVLGIVEDERIFAKLQSDLRQHRAVTNTVIQQKIHVFVHNTKSRRHTITAAAAPGSCAHY